MMVLTAEGRDIVRNLAAAQGVSEGAVEALLSALAAGNGFQAQFNHPELGGMGQWSQGGMIMIGDMFNQGLKYKVGQLCEELANRMRSGPMFAAPAQVQSQSQGGVSFFAPGPGYSSWWPADLGSPASSGSQNDMSYAYFPSSRRLAIRQDGHVQVYDTGDHLIGGVSQQQSGDRSVTFTSQYGVVRVADLARLDWQARPVAPPPPVIEDVPPPAPEAIASPPTAPAPAPAPAPQPAAAPAQRAAVEAPAPGGQDVFSMIEKLAALRDKNILSEEEFSKKKAELLSRL